VTTPEFGVFARMFPRPAPDQVARAIAASGYTATQLNLASFGQRTLPLEEPDPEPIRRAFADAGVRIWALSATFNAIHPDPAVRADGLAGARRVISLASRLSVPVVTLCTGTRDPSDMWRAHPGNVLPDAWRDLRATLSALLPAAASAGVRLGIEPEGGNVIRDARAAARLLAELGPDAAHIGIVFDPANLLAEGTLARQAEILDDAVDLLRGSIVGFHAKDLSPAGASTAAGQGVLDYPGIAGLWRSLPSPVPVIVQDASEEQAAGVLAFLERAWATG
jgi:sugar phosphate isomerase/epimerase